MNLSILVTAPASVLKAVSCKDSDTIKTMLPIVLISSGLGTPQIKCSAKHVTMNNLEKKCEWPFNDFCKLAAVLMYPLGKTNVFVLNVYK